MALSLHSFLSSFILSQIFQMARASCTNTSASVLQSILRWQRWLPGCFCFFLDVCYFEFESNFSELGLSSFSVANLVSELLQSELSNNFVFKPTKESIDSISVMLSPLSIDSMNIQHICSNDKISEQNVRLTEENIIWLLLVLLYPLASYASYGKCFFFNNIIPGCLRLWLSFTFGTGIFLFGVALILIYKNISIKSKYSRSRFPSYELGHL